MDSTKLCLVGVGCLGLLTSCGKLLDYSPDPPKADPKKKAYPVDRMITDKKGRALDVTITGKSPNSIRFLGKSDGNSHDYLISNLSVKDQAFVEGLPLNRKHKMVRPTPPYIASREKELEELERKITRLNDKEGNSKSGIKIDSLRSEIDRIKPRAEQLREQIETYKRQNTDH